MRESVHVSVSNHGPRRLASTGSPWEPKVGYSRAVRIGQTIAVTGTIGLEPDGSLAPDRRPGPSGPGDRPGRLEALGGSASDVIRTRIYVTDIARWEEIAAEHAEVFGAIRPATTMVEVARLIVPEALVEIEADALVDDRSA